MAAATESEICDCVSQRIWVTEKRKLFWNMKDKGPIFILNHRVPLVPLIWMSKNALKILTMDYSEKKKKNYFDINTKNVVLKNIFQMNVFLRGIDTWKSFKNKI